MAEPLDFTPSQFPDDLEGQIRFVEEHPRLTKDEKNVLGISLGLRNVARLLPLAVSEAREENRVRASWFGRLYSNKYVLAVLCFLQGRIPPKDFPEKHMREEMVQRADNHTRMMAQDMVTGLLGMQRRAERLPDSPMSNEAKALWNRLGGNRQSYPRYNDIGPVPSRRNNNGPA